MTMKLDFSGKVAIVTGAGRGIGQVIAQRLAWSGAWVCVNDIDSESARATVKAIRAAGGEALDYAASVDYQHGVEAMCQMINKTWGRLDILVNNAAIEPVASVLDMEERAWDQAISVNLKGTFLCSQAAGRIMQAQGSGVIVNIASTAGHSLPLSLRSAYCASKAGVVGFTKECAREFAAYGIRVNAVCPGIIISPITEPLRHDEAMMTRWMAEIPQTRLGNASEVADLVLFLCSESAGYITGQAIHVDGGQAMV